MAQQHTKNTAPKTSLADVVKILLRLGPKQISDEISLALAQLKSKGVAAGIAAALMVVGLVFVTFLVVALIVAAIAALHLVFELWAAALIVAGAFLLVALVLALVGLMKLKGAMPLVPQDAIRGFRLDLGVAREGSSFDPQSLDRADAERRKAKEEAEEQKRRDAKKPGAGEPEKPTYAELLRRTALRRDHIAGLQDQLVGRKAKPGTGPDAAGPAAPVATDASAPPADPNVVGSKEYFTARWKPLSVLAGSVAAGGVLLRELTKK